MVVLLPSKDVEKPREKVDLDKILKEEIGQFDCFQMKILLSALWSRCSMRFLPINVFSMFIHECLTKDVVEMPLEKVNLDKILLEEIGQFGWFQLRILVLCALVKIFHSWSVNQFIFTTARINTRCVISKCDLAEPVFASPWVEYAVPDGCNRYGNTSVTTVPGTCSPEHFDRNVTLPCDDYVYEKTDTVVYDFDLACDEWRRTLIGFMRKLGSLVSLPITGYISDRWGRRVALLFSTINNAWLGTVRYWVNTYTGFAISEFVESSIGYGMTSTAYILGLEVTGPTYRATAGAMMITCFALGQVLMALIAWAVPNWRILTLALYLPQFITILYIWLITESVRWYMSKGRYAESEILLQKIARTNNKTLSTESLAALRHTAEVEKQTKETKNQQKSQWLIVLVFRHKKILLICLVSPVWWIASMFISSGMSVNALNLSGNRYLNYISVSAVEIPGCWVSMYLINKVGRKPLLIGGFWICAVCQFAYIFLPDNLYAASLTMYLMGKFSIMMVDVTMYLYTAELYPTKYRQSLFAFSSMMGRIGSTLAPLTPAIGLVTFKELPFVLFAGLALLAGALVFLTPETLGTKLPDTIEDAENNRQEE